MKKVSFVLSIIFLLQNSECICQIKSKPSNIALRLKQNAKINCKINAQENVNKKNIAAKTTSQIAERLLAYSTYYQGDSTTTIKLMDSASYKYSWDRSSIFNFNSMDYENSYPMTSANIFGFYSGVGFMNHNDEPTILSDTTFLMSGLPPYDTFQLYDTKYSVYDANNNVIDYADLFISDTTTYYYENRFSNTFDSSSNITTSYNLSWDMGNWDTSENRLFMYNSLQQVIEDSSNMYLGAGVWSPQEKWTYTYNDSGKMTTARYYMFDGSVWQENRRYIMTYYTDNKLQKDSTSVISSTGTTWYPDIVDSFGYNTGYNFWTYCKNTNFSTDTNIAYNYYLFTKNVSILGLPDTLYESNYLVLGNNLLGKYKIGYTYDTYEEPTIDYNFVFHIIDSTGNGYYDTVATFIDYYFYQLYEKFGSSVPTTTAPPQQVIIYPNPATNTLSISMPGYTQGAQVLLTLINAQGQKVRTESLPWLQATTSISLSGLPAGVYWLVVQDGGGNNVGRQMVVKE